MLSQSRKTKGHDGLKMRSQWTYRILILLLVAILVGAVAVPTDAKRPRRYNSNVVLVDWTICPGGAVLTIGYTGDLDVYPDPPSPAEETWPPVQLAIELPSSPASIIEGAPQSYALEDVDNEELAGIASMPDDEGELVTDGAEIPDSTTETATITHRSVIEVDWSPPVSIGDHVRVGLLDEESGAELRFGRYETVFCPSPDDDEPGNSSPGVETPGPSLSTDEIVDLFEEIEQNREAGSGPGGALVPRSECTIIGTPNDDRIEGTPGNDVICGFGGNDVIAGGPGIDLIDGANGNDRVRAGSGKDMLLGLRGSDRLKGEAGDDTASGGAGDDGVRGASGADTLDGGSGNDRLGGGPGSDVIRGASGGDRINARDRRRDTVNGGSGEDRATVDGLGGGRHQPGPPPEDRVRGVERLR